MPVLRHDLAHLIESHGLSAEELLDAGTSALFSGKAAPKSHRRG
jgi:hypothetical protein